MQTVHDSPLLQEHKRHRGNPNWGIARPYTEVRECIKPYHFKTVKQYSEWVRSERELGRCEDFPINPRDIRFFGNPIDYIAFTDMGSKKKCAIHFVEVKSGQSNLNNRQKNIKNAILEGKVHWHEYNVDGIWEHETKDQHLNIEKNG